MSERKVVLITGGGSGLGKSVARQLHQSGLCICATIRGAQMHNECENMTFFDVDMSDHAALPGLVDDVVARYGRLDGLICNAAVQGFGHVSTITLQDWQDTLDVNLTAPFLLAQAATPHLQKTGGTIIFISSVHGMLAVPSRTMYAVSKAGLIAMTRNLAADLSSDGIRVISLILGPFGSPALAEGVARFFPDDPAEVAVEKFAKNQPLGRIGSAEELGALIYFLMSDAAGFITGTSITIDGGQSSRLNVPNIHRKQ